LIGGTECDIHLKSVFGINVRFFEEFMGIRKDGLDTKEKLLRAASEVFTEKGYQQTTVAEIGRRAGSNIAAVNYHFGSKDALYIAVWKNAFEEALNVYPPDGGLTKEAKPQERLRAMIYSHLHRILDDTQLGYGGKILLQEISNPTEALHQVRRDVIRPLRERTRGIIRELLNDEATEEDICFCEMSVIHQCLALGFRKGRSCDCIFEDYYTSEKIDALANHITRFSLAGIEAVRNEIKTRKTKIH